MVVALTLAVQSNRLATPAIEAAMVLLWSSGFIGAVLASDVGAPFTVLFWRFAITAIALMPVALYALQALPRRELARHLLVGGFAMFGYLAGVTGAIHLGVPTGTVALIAALQPLATAAVVSAMGRAITVKRFLALLLGLFGVAFAVGGSIGGAPVVGFALAFTSVAALVVGTVVAKAAAWQLPLVETIALQSIAAALLFLALAGATSGLYIEMTAAFWVAIAWWIGLSTIGGYGLYFLCLQRTDPTRVATLIYLTPFVTAVWALFMFGEPIGLTFIMGGAVCLVAVVVARD